MASQPRLTVFFVLSKLLAFFTQPSNLVVLLGLIGLALTRTRFARAGWRLAAGSLVLIGLIGFLPLGRALSLPLENRFPPWDATGAAPTGIVVLGGAVSANMLATRGEIGINEAAERVVAVPALAKRYPAARIIYSGGDAGLFVHHESEADVVTDLFESLGVPASRLTLEDRSRNTVENAVYSKALAQPKPGERWLLVTSALHMRHARWAHSGRPDLRSRPIPSITRPTAGATCLACPAAFPMGSSTPIRHCTNGLGCRLSRCGEDPGAASGTSAVSARRAAGP
jgi:uncharacterized SAM-binding protein YcdF (DUF218 family)